MVAGLPIAVGVAVLRHRLYGIDPLVNRVLVWATVSAVLLGAYFGIVAAVTALLGGSRAPGRWRWSPRRWWRWRWRRFGSAPSGWSTG